MKFGVAGCDVAQCAEPQQTSGRAFPAVSFVHLSVECPSNKFYGINCRPKLDAKLLDRFFHRRRQVSPPVNNLTHRFFDGSQHFFYCNFTVGSRHGAVASFLPADKPLSTGGPSHFQSRESPSGGPRLGQVKIAAIVSGVLVTSR